MRVTNPETGEVLYQNGSFEPLFLGQLIVENGMCRQTDWIGREVGAVNPSGLDLNIHLKEYLQPLADAKALFVKARAITNPGGNIRNFYMGDGCWGAAFYAKDGQNNALYMWKDPLGKVLYELVFLQPKD